MFSKRFGVLLSLAVLLALSGPVHAAEVPLKAWENGISTFTPTVTPTGGLVLYEEFISVGHSTSGGPFTGVGSDYFDPAALTVADGEFRWTFHAGTLNGTYSGNAAFAGPLTADFWLDGKIEGGTGAFEGVTGTLSLSGTGMFTDPTTFVWTASIEGKLIR